MAPAGRYRFGGFTLDRRAYQLTSAGAPVPLSPRAIDLLLMLVEARGVLFTKDEIFDKLWPDVTVTDNALTQVISELRQALNDKPAEPVFIETVPRRGYRWIAPVDAEADPAAAAQPPQPVELSGHAAQAAQLQSAIVTALMAGLKVTIAAAPASNAGGRETASLQAHKLASDGRLKLETLDPRAIHDAIADFTRALVLDPAYTAAHIGLAHAHFWLYQGTRARNRPDRAALEAAIAHAERAVALAPGSADAHAALAMFLAITPRFEDARREGRLAVSMEPGNWRHHFQLGIAAWGRERLDCLAVVMEQYPALTHAHFAAAMVHIARNDMDAADAVLAAGIETQRQTPADRLPGRGLHWLRGLIAWHRHDAARAREHFGAELAMEGQDLFAHEFAMDAECALGFVALAEGDAAGAAARFQRALDRVPDHARSWSGLSAARFALGDRSAAADARDQAADARKALLANGRGAEAAVATALAFVLDGHVAKACAAMDQLFAATTNGMWGWTWPVEPWLQPHLADPGVQKVLATLADRAK